MQYYTSLFVICGAVGLISAHPDPRIVGGFYAVDGQFPHQAALLRSGSFACGGSIISSSYVLTAAHCVYLANNSVIDASQVTVQHGSVKLYKGTTVQVSKVIPHEGYKDIRNDVALLKLASNIQFDAYTRAIPLRSGPLPFGTPVTISGFGQTSFTSPASDRLKYNLMMVVSDKACAKAAGVAYDGLFCINATGENGACGGDSGGPGILGNALVGVANFVIGGCGTTNPDGYARVSYFIEWIKTNTKDSMKAIKFV